MNKLLIKLYFTLIFSYITTGLTAQWTQKANFGGGTRISSAGFSIGTKCYIGTGYDSGFNPKNDFWEYDPSTNVWTQKANLTTTARLSPISFAIGTKGYMGSGYASTGYLSDFWEYDPSTNVWTQKANYGGGTRHGSVGFTIGTKGYVGTGFNGTAAQNDFWEYLPCTNPTAYTVTGGGTSCSGSTVAIGLSSSETGVTYQLVRGGTTNVGSAIAGTGSAIAFTAQSTVGTYTVVATRTTGGCTATMTGSATVTASSPSASIVASPSNSITAGTSVTFTATLSNGTAPQYQWKKNNNNVGSNSSTYTDATLANNDVITCVLTITNACSSVTTVTSNSITMTVNTPAAALNLDGIDDYVQLPSVLAIGGGDCTFECMVRVPTVGNGNLIANERVGIIIGNFASGASNTAGLEINNLGKVRVYWNAGNVDFLGNKDLRDDTWHHLACVRNTTLNKWFIYIDGVLDNSNTSSGTNPTFSTTFRIGADNRTSGVPYFHGSIDEFRVWNRALSICEIQNNMSCELSSGQTGLVAYYKFNQGNAGISNSGVTSLTDASGNANTGTLNNFALTGTASNWIASGGVTTGTTCTTYTPYYT